jgi:hypothetical protein
MGKFSNSTHDPAAGYLRLPHKWRLIAGPRLSADVVREFIRPAAPAVPRSIARRLPLCVLLLVRSLEEEDITSRWTETEDRLEMTAVAIENAALRLQLAAFQRKRKATGCDDPGWRHKTKVFPLSLSKVNYFASIYYWQPTASDRYLPAAYRAFENATEPPSGPMP